MLYISGLYALNLPCKLDTTGDWHTSALNWKNVYLLESDNSIFKDYGIELQKIIPEHDVSFYVANHIRAILDLLSEKQFSKLGDFKNDFICNDKYTSEIFEKVYFLLPDKEIENYMYKIYGKEWRIWIGEKGMDR